MQFVTESIAIFSGILGHFNWHANDVQIREKLFWQCSLSEPKPMQKLKQFEAEK